MNKSPTLITPELLRRMPLPRAEDGGEDDARGKDKRGQVFVVGGSAEVPGGILLAATGTLRAGAGKLQIATAGSVAVPIALAMPEARVIGLAELPSGGLNPSASNQISDLSDAAAAALYGPGMTDETAVTQLLLPVLRRLRGTSVVLDAAALACLSEDPGALAGIENAVLTPHTVEMALMLGIEESAVTADPEGVARQAAAKVGAVVALKGAETFIATPDGTLYLNRAGNIGLAVSGSGDTLAGIITGLLARGASAEQAAVWGVFLHGRAGEVLARKVGPLGFLAREILPEIPPLLLALQKPPKRRA